MSELRVDPLTGLRTIIAAGRATRPGGEAPVAAAAAINPADDPFAEGNEDRTPPELFALRPDGGEPNGPGWTVRVVPNLYPALDRISPPPPDEADTDLFDSSAATGAHEVIVNAPASVTSLADLDAREVATAVDVWRERMRAHKDAACLHLIVNERVEGGASLPHTHAQLYVLDFVPAVIARERERFGAYASRKLGQDLLADLLAAEVRRGERTVAIDEEAVLIAPWASRMPYQLLLAPRRPRGRFEDDGATGAALLHDALQRLMRLFGATPPLNLWVRTAPRGADHFCWRIDIVPRLTHLAGLELGAGLHLNVIAPERAAQELRGA